MTNEKRLYSYYTLLQLVRGATAPKLSTKERIRMLDEIARREAAGED